jgi:tetratricopeptide (TPR) repeat protein
VKRSESLPTIRCSCVLYGLWVANYVALNVDAILGLANHFQTLARKKKTEIAIMIADRLLGTSLLFNGDLTQARIHYDRAIAAYRPLEHPALATKFGQDNRVAALVYRALTSWILGYPDAALADVDRAVRYARQLNNPTSLMYVLVHAPFTYFLCGDYAAARASSDELVTLADQKGAFFWKAYGLVNQGCHVALSGNYSEAIELLSTRIAAFRSTGATLFAPWYLPYLAWAHASAGNFDEAVRCMGEALTSVEATGERWCDAEAHRVAGEIVLNSPKADLPKAEAHFARAFDHPTATSSALGSFAQRRASRASGAIKAGAPKPMTSSRPSTAGSPRALTRSTCGRRRRCSTRWSHDGAWESEGAGFERPPPARRRHPKCQTGPPHSPTTTSAVRSGMTGPTSIVFSDGSRVGLSGSFRQRFLEIVE